MPDWLNPISVVLDKLEKPATVFFRDDDAGWASDKLYPFLDKFADCGLPVDLAVIPHALDDKLALELLKRWEQTPKLTGLHQHGYSHANHEPSHRRKCEFGLSRNKRLQEQDIRRGRERLLTKLGSAVDPIFTPPWNRCTQDTVAALEELGFLMLSRDITAERIESAKLKEAPVTVNWSRIFKTAENPLLVLSLAISSSLKENDLTGIMFHHADMDADNLNVMKELLWVFANHKKVRPVLLREKLG